MLLPLLSQQHTNSLAAYYSLMRTLIVPPLPEGM